MVSPGQRALLHPLLLLPLLLLVLLDTDLPQPSDEGQVLDRHVQPPPQTHGCSWTQDQEGGESVRTSQDQLLILNVDQLLLESWTRLCPDPRPGLDLVPELDFISDPGPVSDPYLRCDSNIDPRPDSDPDPGLSSRSDFDPVISPDPVVAP